MKLIFYSEILDRHYALTCTRRTLELIEDAKGFDHYILKVSSPLSLQNGKSTTKQSENFYSIQKTPEVDLKSDIGMQLKREMLIALAKKETSLYPNDKQKQDTIYKRYSSYVLPVKNISRREANRRGDWFIHFSITK